MSDLLVSTRKGLFVYRQSKDGWRLHHTSFLGESVTLSLWDARSKRLYAALNLGHFGPKLRRSDNAGRDWTDMAVPTYPPKPPEEEAIEKEAGKSTPWSTQQIWSLEPGHASEEGLLYAGTIPGGLFRSDDHGESWSLVESLWRMPERRRWMGGGYDHAGIHSIAVDPRQAQTLTVGVSVGGVWHTTDGGKSWETRTQGIWADYMPPEMKDDPVIQDPHLLVQCKAQPDHLWVQHHNGIFYSANRGKSWTTIENESLSTFGFTVAVDPKDPKCAWFVPAIKDQFRVPVDNKFVVTRTSDGGKSFEILSKGLPEQDAYHLVYRHGLDINDNGMTLAMGSTTGSLWISEDRGDQWHRVSAELPPIYAIRFTAGAVE